MLNTGREEKKGRRAQGLVSYKRAVTSKPKEVSGTSLPTEGADAKGKASFGTQSRRQTLREKESDIGGK